MGTREFEKAEALGRRSRYAKGINRIDHARVESLYLAGLSYSQVANEMNISSMSVHRILKKRNVKPRPQGHHSADGQKKVSDERLGELRAAGLTWRELSFALDMSVSQIGHRLAKLGLMGAKAS